MRFWRQNITDADDCYVKLMRLKQAYRAISHMTTSSNGIIFRVTGHLCGEFTGLGEFPAQRPVTRSFDVFLDLGLNKRFSKQSRGWWFETQSRQLWRHSNENPQCTCHIGIEMGTFLFHSGVIWNMGQVHCGVYKQWELRVITMPTFPIFIWHLLLSFHFPTPTYMMTSSDGIIFRVTGHLCGEFSGPRWIPHTKASDAELWCFLSSASE